MKVLVATHEAQGLRKSDYCFATDGELVHLPFECDHDKDNIDGGCGCRRGFGGMHSHRATTTAKIVERIITPVEFEAELTKSLRAGGWIPQSETPKQKWLDRIHREATLLLKCASLGDVGDIIEKRGDKIQLRRKAGVK